MVLLSMLQYFQSLCATTNVDDLSVSCCIFNSPFGLLSLFLFCDESQESSQYRETLLNTSLSLHTSTPFRRLNPDILMGLPKIKHEPKLAGMGLQNDLSRDNKFCPYSCLYQFYVTGRSYSQRLCCYSR
jgi:hypothetical protein